MAVSFNGLLLFTFSLIILLSLPIRSQDTTPTTEVAAAPSPSPSADTCNGIFLTYQYEKGEKLSPRLSKGSPKQPYKFESSFSIENTDEVELKQWMVSVGFQHDEFLVSATDVVLFDGTSIPASVGNGTVFAGFPVTDLKTAIETAGDETQTKVTAKLVGTQFGVAPPAVPLPANISLANDGYRCPEPFKEGNTTLLVCCVRDPTFKANVTLDEGFLPRQSGDLTIMYDVTKTYPQNYWAQVTISNHNSLGRLDYWQLSFDWMRDEFIFSMRGAYPSIVETNECVFGKQAQQYADLDFSTALNCQRRPIIVDLPRSYENDTKLGFVQHCCRNGSILPPSMDPSKSISAFQMQVFKMPPDLNRSTLIPPQNWQINGTLNPNYVCGPPIRVSPSEFPDPSGVPTNFTAVASWQIVCNITRSKNASPKCCVSFSAYFNESIIPCKTCACGCPSKTARTCSTTAPALFIPAEAQLVPFDNRTKLALAWAQLKHRLVPNPLPCGDNCGVSLNWHLYTDFNKGWTARVTLFNWEEVSFADWFVAVEMNKAAPGFEKAYSFNGTLMSGNETIFMQGLPGLNYLMGETNGTDPTRDPRVPGKQQSVLSFTKKLTRGINVAEGGGFPTKVYFNGEECSLPDILPINGSHKRDPIVLISFLIAAVVFIFIQQLL